MLCMSNSWLSRSFNWNRLGCPEILNRLERERERERERKRQRQRQTQRQRETERDRERQRVPFSYNLVFSAENSCGSYVADNITYLLTF